MNAGIDAGKERIEDRALVCVCMYYKNLIMSIYIPIPGTAMTIRENTT